MVSINNINLEEIKAKLSMEASSFHKMELQVKAVFETIFPPDSLFVGTSMKKKEIWVYIDSCIHKELAEFDKRKFVAVLNENPISVKEILLKDFSEEDYIKL